MKPTEKTINGIAAAGIIMLFSGCSLISRSDGETLDLLSEAVTSIYVTTTPKNAKLIILQSVGFAIVLNSICFGIQF